MEEFVQEVRQNLEEILKDVKGCDEFLGCIKDARFPWEILNSMDKFEKFDCKSSNIEQVSITGPVYFGKDVKIKPFSVIEGPAIIGDKSIIGPLAYIRPASIIGRNCNLGSFTVFKNSIILDNSNAAHFNYIGDSIIGKNCNFGAASKINYEEEYKEGILSFVERLMNIWKGYDTRLSVTSNLKLNEKEVKVHYRGKSFFTGRRKFGAIIEDNVKIGCNVKINPGSYIDRGLTVASEGVIGHVTYDIY